MALSKNRIKELAKYKQKKNRDEEGVFVAEGWKLVEELARKFECTTLIVTEKAEAAAREHIADLINEANKRSTIFIKSKYIYWVFK